MDPTGILDAVLAVALFPGAAYLALAAALHGIAAGRRPAPGVGPEPLPLARVAPAVAAVLGAALLPLPGSPVAHLPAPGGPAVSVVAVAVLIAVAIELADLGHWSAAPALGALLPVTALAAAAGTLNATVIASAPGDTALAARCLAAALLVLAAARAPQGRGSAAVLALVALAAAALVIPAALPDAPGAVVAALSLGVVAVSGLAARARDRLAAMPVTVAASAASIVAVVLALLATRP